jgi:hypothetical protein
MRNNQSKSVQIKKQREKALAEDRRNILALSPEKAIEAIAEHPYPVTLVQSMAEEDLYLLVHTIGPDEAHPVLALASNAQWEYLLDMEGWDRDRMDAHALTEWIQRLLKADPDRLTHQIAHDKKEAFVFYLSKNIDVLVREYEQDPAEIGDDFFSEDQTYYVRLRPYPEDQKTKQKARDYLVKNMLKRLAVYDYTIFRDMLLECSSLIPAETEEALYRLRNVRMAEKGFLPFEEAVGVYQPLRTADLLGRQRKPEATGGRTVDTHPIRVDAAHRPEHANLFTETLADIQDRATLERLQTEFAGLCNQIIAADGKKIREKTALSQVVRKAGDFISIGLHKATMESAPQEPYRFASLIQHHYLLDLFRVGYGCALALKSRADKWRHDSWFEKQGLPLSFWGESWLGVLGGLLIKRPLFYDNYATGVLYREFATYDDIQSTEAVLKSIIAFDDLLALMEIEPPRSYDILTSQNLILTLWANHYLEMAGNPKMVHPLTLQQFRVFFNALWEPDTKPRQIRRQMRERFLTWLAKRSGLHDYEISERMGLALEQLFNQIEDELGGVEARDLNPNFIYLFLFRPAE